MTISFVVPTRDTPELLLACVESAAREAPGAELIVVDDGGSDEIARRLSGPLPRATTLRHERSLGFSAAANAGLAIASGELLVCLNSDTVLEPGSVSALTSTFDGDPGLGIVGASLRYPDGRRQWSGGAEPNLLWLIALVSGLGRLRHRLAPAGLGEEPALRECDWVSGAAMAIRRSVWESCGPFATTFRFYAQDLDLCRRVHDRGWRVAVAGGFRVLHHHGATVSPRTAAAAGGQRYDLLWTDLADWYELRHGAAAGRRARRTMLAAGRLRTLLPSEPATRRAVEAGLAALLAARATPARLRSK